MDPQESPADENDHNLESPPPRGTPPEPSPASGDGSGESQLGGIPPAVKPAGAGEEEENGERAGAAGDHRPGSLGGEAPLLVADDPEKEQDNCAPKTTRGAAAGSRVDDDDDDGYHTPTSPRHRIPPTLVCPQAPRKPASVRMRTPPSQRRRRPAAVLDLDTKLLVARWWAEKLLRQLQPEDPAAPKRPRIRDL